VNPQHLVAQYGYLAVFVLMLAESACVPVPSEVIMMFGGALAAGAGLGPGAHAPVLLGVVLAGVAGNVAGSYVAWAVGRYAGQPAIRRLGRRVGIREHEIDKANAWFERHGPVAVLLGRMVPVIRTFISLPAGFAAMPAGMFGLYTVLGCLPWTAALGIAGYALGANWESVAKDFKGPTYAIAGLIAVGLVAALIVRRRRAKRGASIPVPAPVGAPAAPAAPAVPAAPATLTPGYQPDRPLAYQSGGQPGYQDERPSWYPAGHQPESRPGYQPERPLAYQPGNQGAYRPGGPPAYDPQPYSQQPR
jgi:membrane protein DedA with SNARE-associated domain